MYLNLCHKISSQAKVVLNDFHKNKLVNSSISVKDLIDQAWFKWFLNLKTQ